VRRISYSVEEYADMQHTNREHAVAQLVEAPSYKPEGRGFDSRSCHSTSDHTMAPGSTQPLTGVKAAGM